MFVLFFYIQVKILSQTPTVQEQTEPNEPDLYFC